MLTVTKKYPKPTISPATKQQKAPDSAQVTAIRPGPPTAANGLGFLFMDIQMGLLFFFFLNGPFVENTKQIVRHFGYRVPEKLVYLIKDDIAISVLTMLVFFCRRGSIVMVFIF